MYKYLFKFKGLCVAALAFICIYSILNTFIALAEKFIIDIIFEVNGLNMIFKVLLFIVGLLLAIAVVNVVRTALVSKLNKNVIKSIRQDIFEKVINMDIVEFQKNYGSDFISILNNDVAILEENYFAPIYNSVTIVLMIVASFIMLMRLDKTLALVGLVLSIISIVLPKTTEKKAIESQKKVSESYGVFSRKTKDYFQGFRVVKSFNILGEIKKEFKEYNDYLESSKYKYSKVQAMTIAISYFGNVGMYIAMLVIGVYLAIKGKTTLGTVMGAAQLTNNLKMIANVGANINQIKSTKFVVDKFADIKHIDNTSQNCGDKLEVFNDSIELNDVNFSYDGEKNVLDGIDMRFEKGQKYAIVGESGCGKTTLLKVLMGYFPNMGGKIMIDKRDVGKLNIKYMSNILSIMQQNVFLFDTTIKNNITLFKDYPEEEIEDVIEKTQLKMLIQSLEDGLDTYIGEAGDKLSGGERQRISMARAFLKKKPILLLDEATSSLDNLTANEIEETVFTMEDVTVISVTHVLNEERLKRYNKIFVLKDGKVIEEGNFDELMNKSEYFYSMYNINQISESSSIE
ncbi:ABC transporter ATP-binding protein [Sporanaerobacter acetigenes]|uniref:ABC transporter ATP-binding protein n=1 Tax=Sporanaerobacter acetigenes TaxID=165813 RepID=UPI00331B95FA